MKTTLCHPCILTLLLFLACLACGAEQHGTSEAQRAAEIRQELRSIDYRHYRNLDDYLSKCNQVRALLPSLESFYKWSDEKLERLTIKDSGDPQLLRLADFYRSLNAEDKAGLQVLQDEMDLATAMSKLPTADRPAFFHDRILPLERKEDQLSTYEVKMARDAKKNGLYLPPWFSRRLGKAK